MSNTPAPPQAPLPPGYPAELERIWETANGTRIAIRPLRPDDLDREIAFVGGLSEETLYLRLQYSSRNLSREEAARMLDLDYHDRLAVGALAPAESGDAIIGVSRYARIDDTDQAECAIVVADGWQGRGVGTELMRSLGIGARSRGIRTLVGTSFAVNQRILDWARRFGFDVHTEPNSGGLAQVTLDLASLAA